MGVELITHNDETRPGIGLDQPCDMLDKVGLRSGVGHRWREELAGRQIEISGHDLCAVSDVIEFSTFDLLCLHWQGFSIPLKGLDTWFFVCADRVESSRFGLNLSGRMHLADLLDLLCKLIPVLDIGMFPVSAPMRLQHGFLLKNARFGLGRYL